MGHAERHALYNKAAIEKMKPAMQALEANIRETFPSKGLPAEDEHARSEILSAMGSLGSVDTRRLENKEYASTIDRSIALVTGAAPDAVREKVTTDPVIMAGLAQLTVAISTQHSGAKSAKR